MPRHAQGRGGYGAKAGSGVADWQALELQLNRTRVLLQEILVHLQEVLKNLRSTRPGATAQAGRTEAGTGSRFRAQSTPPPGASERQTRSQSQTTAGQGAAGAPGASERARFKARPPFEARAQAAGPFASQAAPGARQQASATGQPPGAEGRSASGNGSSTRSGQSTFRAQAQAGTHRERPRPEATFRARAGGPEAEARSASGSASRQQRGFAGTAAGSAAGAGQSARAGATGQTTAGAGQAKAGTGPSAQGRPAGPARPHVRPRPERAAQGFRPDRDRQHRAREMARKNGMNLKCAYDILCLDYPCSVDEIKNAYRHMARMHHPDLGGDEEAMKDVNVAYEMAMRFSAGRRTATAWAV